MRAALTNATMPASTGDDAEVPETKINKTSKESYQNITVTIVGKI